MYGLLKSHSIVKGAEGAFNYTMEKLSFKEHINDKISKAYMMLGTIQRNVTNPTFVLFYFVGPIIAPQFGLHIHCEAKNCTVLFLP